jgi:hypothetical protein
MGRKQYVIKVIVEDGVRVVKSMLVEENLLAEPAQPGDFPQQACIYFFP